MTWAYLQFNTSASDHLVRASRFNSDISAFSSFSFQCPVSPSISRPPNNIQNAQGLGRSALASSGIYLHGKSQGSAKLHLEIIERFLKPLQRHYSTINDHQSKSISSTYDTTSDMMQNHWLLWYYCASTNSSWTSNIFPQNLSFTPSFSLTFQVSSHLQCLIQCLHCPSKELCVDVLAWMNLWMNPQVTSADGFPKWWHCGLLDVSESIEMGKPIHWEWNVWRCTLRN